MKRITKARALSIAVCYLMLFCWGCQSMVQDVSDKEHFMKGLKCDANYSLKNDAFLREYQNVVSVERPMTPLVPYTIAAFNTGQVNDSYVKGVLKAGAKIKLRKVLLRDYVTHNALLYYADVWFDRDQRHNVLVNSLMDEPSQWLEQLPTTSGSDQDK